VSVPLGAERAPGVVGGSRPRGAREGLWGQSACGAGKTPPRIWTKFYPGYINLMLASAPYVPGEGAMLEKTMYLAGRAYARCCGWTRSPVLFFAVGVGLLISSPFLVQQWEQWKSSGPQWSGLQWSGPQWKYAVSKSECEANMRSYRRTIQVMGKETTAEALEALTERMVSNDLPREYVARSERELRESGCQ
jgi:hypothetical protein